MLMILSNVTAKIVMLQFYLQKKRSQNEKQKVEQEHPSYFHGLQPQIFDSI